jgi:hypothetical protein
MAASKHSSFYDRAAQDRGRTLDGQSGGSTKMNTWKAIALTSMASMTLMLGLEVAQAKPQPAPPTFVQGQPHMQAALDHLVAARAELDKAEQNKGGWREAAIQKADGAIADVRRGMAFADTH